MGSSNSNPDVLAPFLRDPGPLLRVDFQDAAVTAALAQSMPDGVDKARALGELQIYQRLLRLIPTNTLDSPAARATQSAVSRGPAATIAHVLLEHGMDSAHRITSLSHEQFVKEYGPRLGDQGAVIARQIYANAVDVKTRSMHLWANVASLTAAPHFQALAVSPVPKSLVAALQALPGYDEMFGSLNYCACAECRSIFGPAAYLVDLLRLIDKAITQPNTEGIPADSTLDARRPDLARIPLTCENTNTPVPYLQIVNEVLERALAKELQTSDVSQVYSSLAQATYPNPLPLHRPLAEIRAFLGASQLSLATIYEALDRSETPGLAASLERLDLSPDELKPPAAQPPPGLDRLDTFMAQTGLSRQDVVELLEQNLGADERAASAIPHGLFINQSLGAGQYLQLTSNTSDPENPHEQIVPAIPGTLDALNRFSRLARKLGWPPRDLDWVLTSLRATKLDETAIVGLAQVQRLQSEYRLPLDLLTSLWFDLRTIGTGQEGSSQAPFDVVFNSPEVVARTPGARAYRPRYAGNPLYQDTLARWRVGAEASGKNGTAPAQDAQQSAQQIVARIPATADDLTAIAGALFGEGAVIDLTVGNLSAMYRHAVLPRPLGLRVSDYLVLVRLLGLVEKPSLAPGQVVQLVEALGWMRAAGLTVYGLAYLCHATRSPYVQTGYDPAQLTAFMRALRAAMQGVQPTPDAQDARFAEQLGAFFGVEASVMTAVVKGVEGILRAPRWQDVVLAQTTDADAASTLEPFIVAVSQYLALMRTLRLSLAELRHVFRAPAVYGIDPAPTSADLTPTIVRNIFWLQQLRRDVDDKDDGFIHYFDQLESTPPATEEEAMASLQSLQRVTGWDAAQCRLLCKQFFDDALVCNTVERVHRLQRVFALGKTLGVDVYFLHRLGHLKDATDWSDYAAMSGALVQALKAQTPREAWPTTYRQLAGTLEEQKRAALVPALVGKLGRLGITTARQLSEHLLIDVEMSGCAEISYVKEALNCAQLYLQRCRLNLEPGAVVNAQDISEVSWEWLMNYRVWEANRQVFLYPENYIDPTLRQSKTALFQELANTLLQGEITPERVETAYRKYLDDFARLAKLKYIDAYHGPDDALYLFARTQTEPYSFYYITRESSDVWSEWRTIDVPINAQDVTPLYAHGKLFVFWVELTQKKEVPAGNVQKSTFTRAAIKYSFHNFTGQWVQPQTLLTDQVIHVDAADLPYSGFAAPLFDLERPYWHKVGALSVAPANYADTAHVPKSTAEKICIVYGPLIDAVGSGSATLAAPTTHDKDHPQGQDSREVLAFKRTLATADEMLLQMRRAGQAGYVPLYPAIVLNQELEGDFLLTPREYLILTPDQPAGAAPPVARLMAEGRLVTHPGANALYEAYVEGTGLEPFPAAGGSDVVFDDVAPGSTATVSVKNQPGWFLCSTDGETFLLAPESSAFPQVTDALRVDHAFSVVTPASFTSRHIDAAISTNIFDFLQDPADETSRLVDDDGRVDRARVQNTTVDALRLQWCRNNITPQQAQEVKAVLLTSGPTSLTYVGRASQSGDTPLQLTTTRLTTSAVHELSRRLFTEGLDGLLSLGAQQPPEHVRLPFDRLQPGPDVVPPAIASGDQVSFDGPYGNYYWELFFHGPMLVARLLNSQQRFKDAQRWLEYIFKPTVPPIGTAVVGTKVDTVTLVQDLQARMFLDAKGEVTDMIFQPGAWSRLTSQVALGDAYQAAEIHNALLNRYLTTPTARYWQFLPFRNHTLESLQAQLQNSDEIAAYMSHPFDPHAIARLRIGAYEKAVVMQHIGNLLDWGDAEFARYTWESLTSATMLYLYAYDLLGSRPRNLGPCATGSAMSFADIRARYASAADGIPQFLLTLEQRAGNGQRPPGQPSAPSVPWNEVEAYFCVPENAQFAGCWDRVEDRLTKIRHCLNLAGQQQSLPLFEPPIDPAALVRAAAAGRSVLDALAQGKRDVPFYRFGYLLERAKGVTATLTELGAMLLAALEKHDAEALARVRATHEQTILNMTTLVKQRQIEDLQHQLAALQDSRRSAQERSSYYQQLMQGGLNAAEQANLAQMANALGPQEIATGIRGVMVPAYLLPNIWGFSDGGMQFGAAVNAGAEILDGIAATLNQRAALAATTAQFQRRAQEWDLQKEIAQHDITQVDAQIAATQARLAGSQQELAIHTTGIAQAQAEEDFLRRKFTNRDLYVWMLGRLSTLYFQTYRLALDLALAAQTACGYELDRDDTYIALDAWDSLHKGLLAGEALRLSLHQMESAYVANSPRRLEIEKTISLRLQRPDEFLAFKSGADGQKGHLPFTLPQSLFDGDFPGHFCRKLKSVSLSIPAIVGPYQNINATLTQRSNTVVLVKTTEAIRYVLKPDGKSVAPGTVCEDRASNQQIALSRGVDDAGLFVLDFRDERYLPFEGTGAVSVWDLRMPPECNPGIDFDSIADVIVTLRYTARDGGLEFAKQVRAVYAEPGQGSPAPASGERRAS
jgi:hypothetical protein